VAVILPGGTVIRVAEGPAPAIDRVDLSRRALGHQAEPRMA